MRGLWCWKKGKRLGFPPNRHNSGVIHLVFTAGEFQGQVLREGSQWLRSFGQKHDIDQQRVAKDTPENELSLFEKFCQHGLENGWVLPNLVRRKSRKLNPCALFSRIHVITTGIVDYKQVWLKICWVLIREEESQSQYQSWKISKTGDLGCLTNNGNTWNPLSQSVLTA